MPRLTDDELEAMARCHVAEGPRKGDYYRHRKGGLYEIVGRGIREDTHEEVVIYRKFVKGGPTKLNWVRSLAEFNATVEVDGVTGLRFVREPEPTKGT